MGANSILPELEGVVYETNTNGKATHAVVTLDFPLTETDQIFEKLKFRRLKSKDTVEGEDEDNKVMAGYMMYARLAGIPIETFLEIDVADVDRIAEALLPLMGKSVEKALKVEKAKLSAGETSY